MLSSFRLKLQKGLRRKVRLALGLRRLRCKVRLTLGLRRLRCKVRLTLGLRRLHIRWAYVAVVKDTAYVGLTLLAS